MGKFKKYLTVSNILTVIILGLFLYNRLPVFLENSKQEGKVIQEGHYAVINASNETMAFPSAQEKSVVIFWATWCGPCKVEMNRLTSSVKEGKITSNKIIAINPFEDVVTVKKFLKDNAYPFIFLDASYVGRDLGIQLTPTTLFVDKGVITSMSSGMSLFGIWRAENFLR